MQLPLNDTLKLTFGILSLIPAVAAYVIYFRHLLAGRVKPHAFSWLIWGILAGNGFIAQFVAGAGLGAWVTGLTRLVWQSLVSLFSKPGEVTLSRLDWTGYC